MPKRNRHVASRALTALVVVLVAVHLTPAHAAPPPSPLPRTETIPQYSGPTSRIDWSQLGHAIELERFYELARFYEWASQQPPPMPARHVHPVSSRVVDGSGACGGDLPPCSVMVCESHGNLVAENPRSTASGKWQILDSTWAGYGGYARASDAPEDVQDARAREIYAGGAGRSQWVC